MWLQSTSAYIDSVVVVLMNGEGKPKIIWFARPADWRQKNEWDEVEAEAAAAAASREWGRYYRTDLWCTARSSKYKNGYARMYQQRVVVDLRTYSLLCIFARARPPIPMKQFSIICFISFFSLSLSLYSCLRLISLSHESVWVSLPLHLLFNSIPFLNEKTLANAGAISWYAAGQFVWLSLLPLTEMIGVENKENEK